MFLADMGADVIHVESRDGDMMRRYETLWGNRFLLDNDRNTFTEDLLRNKRSLTVDLNADGAKGDRLPPRRRRRRLHHQLPSGRRGEAALGLRDAVGAEPETRVRAGDELRQTRT